MSIKTNVLTTCEYEKCAQGVTNELTTWHLPIMANQLTHLFVWSVMVVIQMMMSSLYIDRAVFPTHLYCATANKLADMQSFEEAIAWGAVTFVKYVDKYVNN